MSDTPYITEKKADAQAVVDALQVVRNVVEALRDQPHWFGGLPESLTQATSGTDHHVAQIRAAFQLPSSPAA